MFFPFVTFVVLFCTVRELFQCVTFHNLVIPFSFFSYFWYHFAFKPHLRNRLNCGLIRSQSHLVFDPFVLVSRTTGTSSAVSVAFFLASHYITAIHSTVFFFQRGDQFDIRTGKAVSKSFCLFSFMLMPALLKGFVSLCGPEPGEVDRIQSYEAFARKCNRTSTERS